MDVNTPTIEEITAHFSKAKEVRCLRTGLPVEVSLVKDFTYDETDNSWNSAGGAVQFWKDGEFAKITRKKCGENCRGCKPCAERNKK